MSSSINETEMVHRKTIVELGLRFLNIEKLIRLHPEILGNVNEAHQEKWKNEESHEKSDKPYRRDEKTGILISPYEKLNNGIEMLRKHLDLSKTIEELASSLNNNLVNTFIDHHPISFLHDFQSQFNIVEAEIYHQMPINLHKDFRMPKKTITTHSGNTVSFQPPKFAPLQTGIASVQKVFKNTPEKTTTDEVHEIINKHIRLLNEFQDHLKKENKISKALRSLFFSHDNAVKMKLSTQAKTLLQSVNIKKLLNNDGTPNDGNIKIFTTSLQEILDKNKKAHDGERFHGKYSLGPKLNDIISDFKKIVPTDKAKPS